MFLFILIRQKRRTFLPQIRNHDFHRFGKCLFRNPPEQLIRDLLHLRDEMIHPEHVWQFQCVDAAEADADDALLKQAVRILVDNAVKYTKPGECIRLRVLLSTDGAPCIEVQDSGIGISEEDMTHVFERFFRADPARNAGAGGTGLGLAIAKWIVDRHGGHFELRSEPGAGTRITICLPKPSPTAA